MPSFEQAEAAAGERMSFSNGTEGDAWMENWCYRCAHEETCVLVLVAMLGKTPRAWEPDRPGSLGHQYTCTAFEAAK